MVVMLKVHTGGFSFPPFLLIFGIFQRLWEGLSTSPFFFCYQIDYPFCLWTEAFIFMLLCYAFETYDFVQKHTFTEIPNMHARETWTWFLGTFISWHLPSREKSVSVSFRPFFYEQFLQVNLVLSLCSPSSTNFDTIGSMQIIHGPCALEYSCLSS